MLRTNLDRLADLFCCYGRVRANQDADDTLNLYTRQFMCELQTAFDTLSPGEFVSLDVSFAVQRNIELMELVLLHPCARNICAIKWTYGGKRSTRSIARDIVQACPNLATLQVSFSHHSATKFACAVLEQPGNDIRKLIMADLYDTHAPRLFAVLRRSQVTNLAITIPEHDVCHRELYAYLECDHLEKLQVAAVWKRPLPRGFMAAISGADSLKRIAFWRCTFTPESGFSAFPKRVKRLVFNDCAFTGAFDWSFLIDSGVQELAFFNVTGVNGWMLGAVLSERLQTTTMNRLCLGVTDFSDALCTRLGCEFGKVRHVDLHNRLNHMSLVTMGAVLRSSTNIMKTLVVTYNWNDSEAMKTQLTNALKHHNCILDTLAYYPGNGEPGKRVAGSMSTRRVLFALLQGRPTRFSANISQRLPLDMYRLLATFLI